MVTISLCMIVKNEEAVIERCLKSVVGIVDEIIIVDTGSSDNTKKIASEFTDKIYDFEWVNDFSMARNYSFSFAKSDYILWLDADDVIEPADKKRFLQLKKTLKKSIDMVYMKYHIAFDKNGTPTFSFLRERLIKNCKNAVWVEPVHEVIMPFGNSIYSEAGICHKKIASHNSRNLEIIEAYQKKGNLLSPRLMYYYARELMHNSKLREACEAFENFLNMDDGFVENKIGACKDLYRCKKHSQGISDSGILYKSFDYDTPRAEIACELGWHFFEKKNYKCAEYWYLRALECKIPDNSLGFNEASCYDYIPLLQLCVICDKTNRKSQAKSYNDRVGLINKNDSAYLHNKQYFESLGIL